MPSPPSHLNGDAKWKWEQTWPRLDHRMYDHARDGDVLMLYCTSYSTWREANRKIDNMGALVKDKTDRIMPNPYVAIAEAAEQRITDLAAQLGLRPDQPVVSIVPWQEIALLLGPGEGDDE